MTKSIGIHGVGTYLPPDVRTNDWWSEHVAKAWKEKAARRIERIRAEFEREPGEVARTTLEAIMAVGDDAFHGARERRVIPPDMKVWDMETAAAREAVARSGIPPEEIDVVLSYTMIPDFINVPSACVVHSNLGLRPRCTTMAVDAVCNSFMMQLTLAQSMIGSGQARYVLLTQSSALTRLPASGEPIDVSGGDGASALVVGPVSEGHGILGYSHHTDGSLWGALVCGAPGKHWTEDRCTAYSEDRDANLDMFTRMTARAKEVVGEALTDAGLTPEDVAFFACHQPFPWLRAASQACIGMTNARSVDHFQYTGTLSAVNLPFQLAVAEKEGLLKAGDVVACFQGGTGMTWSGMTLRWGR
jgi:3-oxoacyl-[acyl-carrier-protein] synthase III